MRSSANIYIQKDLGEVVDMYIDGLELQEVMDKFSDIIIRKRLYQINTRREKSNHSKNKGNGPILSDKSENNNASWIMAMQISYLPLA